MEPTDPVSVTLKAQDWNTLIMVLHDAPYRIAAPLIQEIATQARAAAEPPPAMEPVAEAAPQPANGHDKAAAEAVASG